MKPIYRIKVHPKERDGWKPDEYPYSTHANKLTGNSSSVSTPFTRTKQDVLDTIAHQLESWSRFDSINQRQYPLPDKTNTEIDNQAPELIEDREIWAFLAKFKREVGGTPDITSFFGVQPEIEK